ncbi:TonB-dependent receptor [Sphingomonas sp.]|uniref:TonB-dependent receptor n=1 Tax=Sphingomonas sp. TaxID=28214 RepID=UPI001EC03E7D|nr:TonB-dependent receptor [Sphingomonas sp.]MBX3594058.1 TonB-dependent receptor [Sphingomonas sp.]
MTSSHAVTNRNVRRSRTRALATALAWSSGAAALAIGFSAPAYAQQVNASLRGKITAEGGVSQVTAINVDTGLTRSVTAGTDGTYNIASLPPGTYRLEVTTPNGVRRTDEFRLSVAQDAVLDFDLSAPAPTTAAGGDEGIIVTGSRIRTMEGGEVGVNITQRDIEQLPQVNRNFLAFADLAPGVQFVTGSNGQSRLQGGAQDSRTVNIFIDGVGQKDYVLKNGVTGQDSTQGNPFPQLAVGEYRVISSNYKAEFDQVSSVAITAVTKSGTNTFHGEGFIDYTDQHLREATPVELMGTTGKAKTRDFQFGGSLGGPIVKDLLHFFVSYEGKRQQVPVDILPGTTNNTQNIPTSYLGEFGSTNRVFNEDLYFGKLTFSPTTSDLIELSGKVRIETGEGLNSGSNLRSNSIDSNVDEYRGLARWEHTADNWVNDFKVTYEDARWSPTPRVFANSSIFRDANNAQIFRTGGGANYQDKGQKGWGLQDDFTYTKYEGHTIKAGVKAKWVTLRTLQQNLFNAAYEYNTQYNPTAQNLTGTWNDQVPYRVQFGFNSGLGGSPEVVSKNFQLGLYVQDDWEVNDRLTINAGIRWDYDRTPSYINFVTTQASKNAVSAANYPNLVNADYNISDYFTDGTQRKTFLGAFQPRIGFSYELDDAAKWVLFGGYGRSYDRNQFDFLQQEVQVGSYSTRTFNFQVPGDTRNNCTPSSTCVVWNPIYLTEAGRAQLVQSVGALGGSELRFFTNDLKVPYSDQFSLGLRGRVSSLLELEVGYSHVESHDGFALLLGNRLANGQFFQSTGNQSSPFGSAPPGRGSIIIGTNGLETSADTAYFKLNKRYTPTSPWSLTATYTYTQATENRAFGQTFALDFPSVDDYPTMRSSGVPKHRFVAAGSVDLPFEFTLSGKLTLSSPPYMTAFANDGNGKRIVVGTEGNNRQPFILGDVWAQRQIDLALTKYVTLPFITSNTRVRFRVDVLNVLNERNYTQYNTNANDTNPTPLFDSNNKTINPGQNGTFGDLSGYSVGGYPMRTFKFSAGFSF